MATLLHLVFGGELIDPRRNEFKSVDEMPASRRLVSIASHRIATGIEAKTTLRVNCMANPQKPTEKVAPVPQSGEFSDNPITI